MHHHLLCFSGPNLVCDGVTQIVWTKLHDFSKASCAESNCVDMTLPLSRIPPLPVEESNVTFDKPTIMCIIFIQQISLKERIYI